MSVRARAQALARRTRVMGNTTRQKVRARRFAFSPAAMTSAWQSTYFKDLSLIMAGVVLATVPLVLLFGFFGRQLVSGIMAGAVKG